MSAHRRRHSDEFKVRAVKLALSRDVQVQDVARALDIHPFMLSRWIREYRDGKLTAPVSRPLTRLVRQQSRLRRLEREVAVLRRQTKLLEKAQRQILGKRGF